MNGNTPIRQVGWCRSGRHRITGDLDIKRWASPDRTIREMCRHCNACGRLTIFIDPDGICINCYIQGGDGA